MEAKDSERESLSRVIRLQLTASIIAIVTYFYIGYFHLVISVPDNPNMINRFIFTMRWGILEIFPVAQGMITVRLYRSVHPLITGDPRKSEQACPPRVAVHVRFLTNTVEQVLMHLPGLFVFASYTEPENLKLVPLFSIFFVIARMLYWIGYWMHYQYRGLGMNLTVWPTLFLLGYSLFCLVQCGATIGININ